MTPCDPLSYYFTFSLFFCFCTDSFLVDFVPLLLTYFCTFTGFFLRVVLRSISLISGYLKRAHPSAVLLPILFPVVSRVAEHQLVGRQPIRAAIATLRSDGSDACPPAQVHLQPLMWVRAQRRPTASSWEEERETHLHRPEEEEVTSQHSQRRADKVSEERWNIKGNQR